VELYRARFKPSPQQPRPYVMLGFNIFAADSDAEARYLSTSMQQAFVNLRSGRPGQLPVPVEGYDSQLPAPARAMLAEVLACSAIGAFETVRRTVASFIERMRPDELMITAQIFDHSARLHSYEIAADVHESMAPSPAVC